MWLPKTEAIQFTNSLFKNIKNFIAVKKKLFKKKTPLFFILMLTNKQ